MIEYIIERKWDNYSLSCDQWDWHVDVVVFANVDGKLYKRFVDAERAMQADMFYKTCKEAIINPILMNVQVYY